MVPRMDPSQYFCMNTLHFFYFDCPLNVIIIFSALKRASTCGRKYCFFSLSLYLFQIINSTLKKYQKSKIFLTLSQLIDFFIWNLERFFEEFCNYKKNIAMKK